MITIPEPPESPYGLVGGLAGPVPPPPPDPVFSLAPVAGAPVLCAPLPAPT